MREPIDVASGARLRRWREERSLTQEELAARAGTTGAVVSLLETGDRKLSPKWLERLSKALDISAGTLLDADPASENAAVAEITSIFSRLPPERQKHLKDIVRTFGAEPKSEAG